MGAPSAMFGASVGVAWSPGDHGELSPTCTSGAGPGEPSAALGTGGTEGRDVTLMWPEDEWGWEQEYGGAVPCVGLVLSYRRASGPSLSF